jgi:arylsulfatase A-like enzyme
MKQFANPCIMALSISATVIAAEPAASAKPNIVLILTDDQGYGDLSCHGNPVLKTPHLDKLHAESLRLTDFHASPVCSPTRAALLTGLDALKAGIWSTATDRSMMLAGLPTMADVFAAGGYRTGLFGKWHLGDAPPYRPQDRGFHETLYEPGGMIGMTVEAWNNDVMNPVLQHNGRAERFTGYREDILFDEAMKWMRECQRSGRPFLTCLATFSPHGPCLVPEKYAAPYRKGPGKRAADFFGMIANLDENAGRLDAFLAETGLRENTLLIFMTDNGGTAGVRIHNAGMRGNKGDPVEGGHRVPCFLRWPAGGFTGGRDIGELAAHLDLLPTLADLCGLKDKLPAGLDGVSLAPLLRGEVRRLPPRFLFVRHDQELKRADGYRPDPFRHSAVLTGPWRLIEGRELYDIANDPSQERDLAAQHPGRVRQMREAQEAHWSGVYPRTFDARRPIRIGDEPVTLTPLSARPEQGEALVTQRHVRSGQPSFAEWTLQVTEPARYRLEARRWPAEAETALTAAVPAFRGAFMKYPPGKTLPIAALRVRVAGIERTLPCPAGAKAIATTLELPTGELRLTARFLDSENQELTDAYYLTLTKAKP